MRARKRDGDIPSGSGFDQFVRCRSISLIVNVLAQVK